MATFTASDGRYFWEFSLTEEESARVERYQVRQDGEYPPRFGYTPSRVKAGWSGRGTTEKSTPLHPASEAEVAALRLRLESCIPTPK